MRNFNEGEKKVLTRLVTNPNKPTVFRMEIVYVVDLFEMMAKETRAKIELNKQKKDIKVFWDERAVSLFNKKYKYTKEEVELNYSYNIEYQFSLIVSLLKYLENNYLIYIYPLHRDRDTIILENYLTNLTPPIITQIAYRGSLNDYIFENLENRISSTPELIEFVKNGSRDKEQINHDQNAKLQKWSMVLATALGIISILIALLSLVPEDRKQQLFGTKKKVETEKQMFKGPNSGTVIVEQTQATSKKRTITDTPNLKVSLPDTLKN